MCHCVTTRCPCRRTLRPSASWSQRRPLSRLSSAPCKLSSGIRRVRVMSIDHAPCVPQQLCAIMCLLVSPCVTMRQLASPRVTSGEAKDLAGHLNVTRQRLEENEREKICLTEEKAHLERVRGRGGPLCEGHCHLVCTVLQAVTRLSSRGDETETAVQRLRTELDDTRQENTELISRVCVWWAESRTASDSTRQHSSRHLTSLDTRVWAYMYIPPTRHLPQVHSHTCNSTL